MGTFIRLRAQRTGEWFVHPHLRGKLVADADRLDTSLTEIVIKILADRYRLPHEIGGRKTKPTKAQDVINLGDSLSERLIRAIKVEASRNGRSTWIDQIRHDLCVHYGLRVPPRTTRRVA